MFVMSVLERLRALYFPTFMFAIAVGHGHLICFNFLCTSVNSLSTCLHIANLEGEEDSVKSGGLDVCSTF